MQNSNTNKKIVKLNIGGLSFHTDRDKLVSASQYFQTLLEGDMQNLMRINDEIFIERCGFHFECILQYLRTGQVHHGNNLSLQDIRREAEYYHFNALVEKIDECILHPNKHSIEYSFLDVSELIPRPVKEDDVARTFQIIHVLDVKQAHNICWQHGGKYNAPSSCQHGANCKRKLNQLTTKLLVKKGI